MRILADVNGPEEYVSPLRGDGHEIDSTRTVEDLGPNATDIRITEVVQPLTEPSDETSVATSGITGDGRSRSGRFRTGGGPSVASRTTFSSPRPSAPRRRHRSRDSSGCRQSACVTDHPEIPSGVGGALGVHTGCSDADAVVYTRAAVLRARRPVRDPNGGGRSHGRMIFTRNRAESSDIGVCKHQLV